MTVVQIADIMGQTQDRRIFLHTKRTGFAHTVEVRTNARRVLQLYHSFVVAVLTDIRETLRPCGVGVHGVLHSVVTERTRRFVIREIERRAEIEVVIPFFHILHLRAEDILVESHDGFAGRDRVEYMIPLDHVQGLTRLLYVVLGCPSQMVTQTVVRMFLMLVEGIEERSLVFGTQVFRSESEVRSEIHIRMQIRCTHSAKTQTYTL